MKSAIAASSLTTPLASHLAAQQLEPTGASRPLPTHPKVPVTICGIRPD